MTLHKYHGSGRSIPLVSLLDHDMILTTYGTVAAEYKGKRTILHKTLWYRIVLDEGMQFPLIG